MIRAVIVMTLASGPIGVATLSHPTFVSASHAQSHGDSGLPTVTGATVPLYPPIARVASLRGTVVLLVKTSGNKVESTKILSGHPLLAQAAESNIRTWTFIGNPPQSMKVVYLYEISEKCEGEPLCEAGLPERSMDLR